MRVAPILAVLLLALGECRGGAPPYSYETAERLCLFSFAAYQYTQNEQMRLLAWDCEGCCALLAGTQDVSTVVDPKSVTFAFLARDPLLGWVLSFRGTVASSLKSWIEDLHASRSRAYPTNSSVRVHKGFYNTYLSVQQRVRQLVQEAQPPHLWVTGHSLGGGLAQLAALDIRATFPDVLVSVSTYGTPRTGNAAFSDYYSRRVPISYRTVHYRDLVPHLPPHLHSYWEHTPNEAWYDEAFALPYTFCAQPESKNCSDSVVGDSLDDHVHYFNYLNHNCVKASNQTRL